MGTQGKTRLKIRGLLIAGVFALMALFGVTSAVAQQSKGDNVTAQSLIQQGLDLLRQGKLEQAKVEFDKAVAKDANVKAQVHYLLGNGYIAKRDTAKAVAEFEKALKLSPDKLFIYINLAQAYQMNNQLDKVVETYTTLMDKDPKSALPHFNLANIFMQKGWYAEAVQEYNKALELDESGLSKTNIYMQLGYANEQLKHYEDALDAYGKSLKKNPRNAAALYGMGNIYYLSHQLDKALEQFNKALDIAPKDARIYANAGFCYYYKKDFSSARQAFEVALNIAPDLHEAMFGMSMVCKQDGDYKKALDYALKARSSGYKVSDKYIERLKEQIGKKKDKKEKALKSK